MTDRFKEIYMSADVGKPHTIYYSTIFLTRRITYAGCIMFSNNPTFQLTFIMIFSSAILGYLITIKPLESKILNNLEIFNESTFLLLVIINFLFTEFVYQLKVK
jgi:TRAP-type C4-dicarboxylate transport system permease large subunit